MKMALIQFNPEWELKKGNFERASHFIRRASHDGCDVIVFPEMFCTGFSMNIEKIAEEKEGTLVCGISHLARSNNINIIAGVTFLSKDNKKGLNMALVVDRKGVISAKYAKIHPFTYAGEDKSFQSGNNIVTFQLEKMTASIFICYDLRFPEIFRAVAKTVQGIFVIANWPEDRIEHWNTLLKARAIENQCFVIGVNRTGADNAGQKFPGYSHVFDPSGKNLTSDIKSQEYNTCEINPSEVIEVRKQFPFLNDMKLLSKFN